jgi:hypothetical protein
MRAAKHKLAAVTVIAAAALYGSRSTYGWRVDVASVTPEPGFATPSPDPRGGIALPPEGQWLRVHNFSPFPAFVEACMATVPVYAIRVEKFDDVTRRWIVFPLSEQRACLKSPTRKVVIWPCQSFDTQPIPLSRFAWFHSGDLVRIVALSKWKGRGREFPSPPFRLV